MTSLRVLLVDDSLEFLTAAATVLSGDPWIELVGCARSGREAISQVERLHPDLVLMDVVMPDMNGIEATRVIKARPEAPRVIMLSLHDNVEYRVAAATAGADGFISKTEFSAQTLPLLRALRPYCEEGGKI